MRVLLVSEHRVTATALRLALADHGLTVVVVDPDELERSVADADDVSVAVVDVDLGSEVRRGSSRLVPRLADVVPVVALTGIEHEPELGALLSAGASSIVPKRSSLQHFVRTLELVNNGVDTVGAARRQALLTAYEQAHGHREALARRLELLSPSERAVLLLLMDGQRPESIAAARSVSLPTVRSQIRAVLLKLSVQSQLAAVVMAHRAGWSGGVPA